MEDSISDIWKMLKKHKSKPLQFSSVAGGVQTRLEKIKKHRRSSRFSQFDNLRKLSNSPVPIANPVQSKVEHRRQQLEKWKVEKEKKKKEAALKKIKPFLTGVPHAPLKFVAPPPPLNPMPSTSGMVTRSQSARTKTGDKPKTTKAALSSFAPKNALFKPPEIKTLTKVPKLAPPKSQSKKLNITFDPVLPSTQNKTAKQTRPKAVAETKAVRKQTHNIAPHMLPSTQKETAKQTSSKALKNAATETKAVRKQTHNIGSHMLPSTQKETAKQTAFKQAATETKAVCKQTERPTKGKVSKPVPKTNKVKITPQSSSSSETEQNNKYSPSLISKNSRKSLSPLSSPRITSKTPKTSVQNTTPNIPVPRSESSSEERLRSPKNLDNFSLTPEQIVEGAKNSPFVTMSRGKDNARKEMMLKREEGLLDEDTSNIESVDHFRRQLASEIKRMTDMCDAWDKIMEQTVLPESVMETALSAVGHARLLMTQKLQQFSSLVERCARPEPGAALITPADLHGFWDMVFMQVENVDMRFKKLEELRLCGWVEDQPVEVKKKVVRPTVNVKKAAKPTGGPSRLREMIAAARKAKREQEEAPATLRAPSGDSKTFEAGFFSVSSPVRSPASAPHSSAGSPASKSSLLKDVLSSEAKKASAKKNSTSFAMLRASVLGKNVECDGFSLLPQTPISLTPINIYATPGRSILKSPNTGNKRKPIKMVLFNQSDGHIQDVCVNEENTEETDCRISSADLDEVENKENSKRRSISRQTGIGSMVTRSQRKSMNTTPQDADHDAATPRRSLRKKVLRESDNVTEEKVKRSSRRRKTQN